jgi:hypothetical protein
MPPLSFERPFFIRMSLVSAFFPDVTQQIHSFLASGVISSHTFRAEGVARSAARQSAGNACMVPPATFVFMRVVYPLSSRDALAIAECVE